MTLIGLLGILIILREGQAGYVGTNRQSGIAYCVTHEFLSRDVTCRGRQSRPKRSLKFTTDGNPMTRSINANTPSMESTDTQ